MLCWHCLHLPEVSLLLPWGMGWDGMGWPKATSPATPIPAPPLAPSPAPAPTPVPAPAPTPTDPAPDNGPALDPLLSGTRVTDIQLDEYFSDPTDDIKGQDVIVYGDVDLDTDERALLAKHPEFALFETIDKSKILEEMNTALVKIRWDRRSR